MSTHSTPTPASERLLSLLASATTAELAGLDQEIAHAAERLGTLTALRALVERSRRDPPGASISIPVALAPATEQRAHEQPRPGPLPPVPTTPAPTPSPATNGHASPAAPRKAPGRPRDPAASEEAWLPGLIERIRGLLASEAPLTAKALRIRLKVGNQRLLIALRKGPFVNDGKGLYSLEPRHRPAPQSKAPEPAPVPLGKPLEGEVRPPAFAGGRTEDDLRQAAAFVLLDDGEMLLPEVASEIGCTGAELLPLLRDHPWFRCQRNQGWSLTDEGREALERIDLEAEERGE